MSSINYTNLLGFFSTILIALCNYVKMEDCSQNELTRCTRELSGVSELTDLTYLTKKSDVEKFCPDLQKGLECVQSYTRRCMNQEQRTHFNQLYHGTGELIHKLCEDAPFQEEFLAHAPCMRLVKAEFEGCSFHYQSKLNEISTLYQNSSAEKAIEQVCCAFHEFITCSKFQVQHSCGKDAATFTEAFLEEVSNSLMRLHCSEFTANPGKCGSAFYPFSSSPKLFNLSTSILLLLVSVLNVFLIFIPKKIIV